MIYLIGSLRNEKIPEISNAIEKATGVEVFSDWHSVGPEADDWLKTYSKARGRTYAEALKSYAMLHVHSFDDFHLRRADTVVMVQPAGKSCHIELGISIGRGKKGYILYPDGEPESDRWDVMILYANGVFFSINDLLAQLKKDSDENNPAVS